MSIRFSLVVDSPPWTELNLKFVIVVYQQLIESAKSFHYTVNVQLIFGP